MPTKLQKEGNEVLKKLGLRLVLVGIEETRGKYGSRELRYRKKYKDCSIEYLFKLNKLKDYKERTKNKKKKKIKTRMDFIVGGENES